jgi:hypothetical protein
VPGCCEYSDDFSFNKIRGTSWPAEEPLACAGAPCTVEVMFPFCTAWSVDYSPSISSVWRVVADVNTSVGSPLTTQQGYDFLTSADSAMLRSEHAVPLC